MNRRFVSLALAVLFCGAAAFPSAARADDEGQALLDQAIEKKLSVSNTQELGEVIDLAQQALDKGLNEENTEFAERLLTSSLLQRATAIAQALLRGLQTDPRYLEQLPKLRELAMADLDRLVAIDPDQTEAQYLIGRLQALPGGDRERGVKALDEALRLAEDPADKAKVLAIRALLQPTPEKQLADLDEALKIDPELGEALERRGRLRVEQGQYEEALVDIDAVLEQQPDNAVLLEAKGIALLRLKKVDEAMASFDRALEIEPRMFASYMHRASVYMEKGDLNQAIDELDKSLLINPNNFGGYLLRATCHQRLGEIQKAQLDVKKMLELQPENPVALRMNALMLAAAGQTDEAIKTLEELRAKSPEDTELAIQLSLLYRALSRISEAIGVLGEVIEKNPELGAAYRNRGDALLSLGRQGEALADYEKALKYEPNNATLLNNMAWVLATSPDDSLRDGKRSIELATSACEKTDYKVGFILSTLAAAYAETGNFDEAIKLCKKALESSDESLKEEVAKELASYEEKKPWRELQTDEDKSPPKEGSPAEEGKPAEDKPADEKPADDKPAEDNPKDEAPSDAPKDEANRR